MTSRAPLCRALLAATTLFLIAPTWSAEETLSPYTFEGQYRLDSWTGLSGPLKSRLGHSGLFDLRFAVDGEKAWAWAGGRVFLQAQATHGNHPNRKQSAAQGIDNIEVAVNAVRLFQAWAEQSLFDERVSILFGLLDLNSEFDVTESSATLIHPSFGLSSEIAQTGRNGPSVFPVSSLALRGAWKIDEHFTLRSALFDAVPGDPARPRATRIRLGHGEGTLLINELSYSNKSNEHAVNKLAIGAWRYSSKFDDHVDTDSAGDPIKRKSRGVYALGEHTLWRANVDGSRGIDGFLRMGVAAGSVSQMDKALGAGFTWRGPFESRPKDKLTIGIAAEHNSHKWRSAQRAAGLADPAIEAAYEISYRALVNDSLSVQPDVQWVRSHGNPLAYKDALLLGVRFDIAF